MTQKMVLSVVLDADEKGLVSGLKVGSAELKDFGNSADGAGNNTDTLGKKTKDTSKAMTLLKGAVASIGFGVMANEMYKSIDSTQKLQAQLKTITGSTESAAKELDRLIGFAKKTPFTIDQSVNAFTKLTHLGLNPSEKAMMSYGNTASAMGKDMMQMVEAVADASVGEFERLKEFGIKSSVEGNKVKFTFQGVTTEVGKNSKEIQKYLLDIGETKFAGAMTDQMETLGAKASNLGIAMTMAYKAMGDSGLADAAGNAIDAIAKGIDAITNNMPYLIDKFTTFVGFFAAGAVITYAPALFTLMKVKALEFAAASAVAAGSLSKISIAQSALMALYVGWEIGSWFRDEFLVVRVAALTAVSLIEKGFVNMKHGFESVTAAIKFLWFGAIEYITNNFSDLLGYIASGAELLGMDEYAEQFKKWSNEVKAGTDASGDFEKRLNELNQEREVAIKAIDDNIQGLINHEYAQEKVKIATESSTAASQENTEVVDENKLALEENEKALKALLKELGSAATATGEYETKQALLVQAYVDGKITSQELESSMLSLNKQYEKQYEATSKNADSAEAYAKAWEKAVERIDEAFSDGWLDLLQGKSTSVFDTIKDGFQRMLAEMMHMAITKPIMLNIQQGVTSMLTGGGGMAGSLMGSISSGGSLFSAGSSLLTSGIGGGIMGIGTGVASLGSMLGMSGSIGMLGAGMTSTGAMLGSQGVMAALGNVGTMFSGGGMMAGIGAALPIVGMVAGIASLADSLSGGGLFGTSYKVTDNGVNLGYDNGDFTGQSYVTSKKKKSLFRGTKRKTEYEDMDSDVIYGINAYFDGVENLVTSAAEQLDITTVKSSVARFDSEMGGFVGTLIHSTKSVSDYLENFQSSTKISLEDMTDEEASAAIQAWTQKTADEMITGVFGGVIEGMAVHGEKLTETLTRVMQQLAITTAAFDSINISLEGLAASAGTTALQYSDDVAKAAGGTDNLAALVQTYQTAFFSQEEILTTQLTNAAAQMSAMLSTIGASETDFRAQFEAATSNGMAAEEVVKWLQAGGMVAQVQAISDQLGSIAGESATEMIEKAIADGKLMADQYSQDSAETDPVVQATESQTEQLTDNMGEQTKAIQDLTFTAADNHKEQVGVLNQIATLLADNLTKINSSVSTSNTGMAEAIESLKSTMSSISTGSKDDPWNTPAVIATRSQL